MVVQAPATSAPLGLPVNLFWDVNPAMLDAEKHAGQIIGRVVELGGIDGWRKVRSYYGDDRLRAVVTQLRTLHPMTVSFLCAALELKQEDFRCCTARPFPPAPWIY